MSDRVVLYEDGSMKLDLDRSCTYIVTKWYKSSIAVFKEDSFKSYINKLDTKYSDSGNSTSLIKYLLSAAVSMMQIDGQGWRIPDSMRSFAVNEDQQLYFNVCPEEYIKQYDLPDLLLASENNIDEAVKMTAQKHKE